jgi:hypothetical protein
MVSTDKGSDGGQMIAYKAGATLARLSAYAGKEANMTEGYPKVAEGDAQYLRHFILGP